MILLEPYIVKQSILEAALMLILGQGKYRMTEELSDGMGDYFEENYEAWFILFQREEQREVYECPAVLMMDIATFYAVRLEAYLIGKNLNTEIRIH